jgi:S1-C subfamily serine protease
MREVLALHKEGKVQTGRYEPTGRPARTPEDIPPMKAMIARRKENKCIHCHDVKVAELRHLQSLGRFTQDLLFTYPSPSAVGLGVDPKDQNRVKEVTPRSAADRAGLRPGDVLLGADGQRLLTLADLARVLQLTPKEAKLPVEVRRGGQTVRATLELAGDWRRTADPSWRESLHVAGPNSGFWGGKLNAQEKKDRGIPADALAVRVTALFGAHANRAGLKNGDVVVEFDGLRRDMTIRQLQAHLHLNRAYGDAVPLAVRRGGEELKLTLRLPAAAPEWD